MDVTKKQMPAPHPLAIDFLFENKRSISKIFRDVIGLYEIDHISIALVKNEYDLIFLSYTPSLEYNLISSGLWKYDLSYSPHFYETKGCKNWEELYCDERYHELIYLKQIKTGFQSGISAAIERNNHYAIYSFATKLNEQKAHFNLIESQPALIKIGNYCLEQITKLLPIYIINDNPASKKTNSQYIKIVVNN